LAISSSSGCFDDIEGTLVVSDSRALIFDRNTSKLRSIRSEHKRYRGQSLAMAAAEDANGQLFQFLNQLLTQVEAETNQPETELRSKIKALESETTKVPSISSKQPDELEIAKELDRMSAKLESIDELLSSSSPADLEVQSLLSGTADLWMPVITATTEERQAFAASVAAEEQDTLNNGING